MVQKGNLLQCDGLPLTLYAPGFPILLAIFEWTGLSPTAGASLCALACFFTFQCCWVSILLKALPPSHFRWIASGTLAFSTPTLLPFVFIWTEGPFVCCIALAVYALQHWQIQPSNRYLFGMTIALCLSICFRFAGFFLAAPILAYSFAIGTKAVRKQLVYSSLAVTTTFLLLLLRNHFLVSDAMGHRASSLLTLWPTLQETSGHIMQWVLPLSFNEFAFPSLLATVLFCVICHRQLSLAEHVLWQYLLPFYFFGVTSYALHAEILVDERLFVPIYPFFVWMVAAALQLWQQRNNIWWPTLVAYSWLLVTIVRYAKNVAFWW